MASRSEPTDSLDDFPTPPWAGRALFEKVLIPRGVFRPIDGKLPTCWEPAANRGHLLLALLRYFRRVDYSDIHDYGLVGCVIRDYLDDGALDADARPSADWLITNPPFKLAVQFALQALIDAGVGVALFVRTQWMESEGRFRALFQDNPPDLWAVFCERVPIVKGRIDPEARSATSYSWVIWHGLDKDRDRTTELVWIPRCREEMERAGDYPETEGSLL
ncbi:MAG: SAM-dependent methyltransferase [Pseudomonadota bacterium]